MTVCESFIEAPSVIEGEQHGNQVSSTRGIKKKDKKLQKFLHKLARSSGPSIESITCETTTLEEPESEKTLTHIYDGTHESTQGKDQLEGSLSPVTLNYHPEYLVEEDSEVFINYDPTTSSTSSSSSSSSSTSTSQDCTQKVPDSSLSHSLLTTVPPLVVEECHGEPEGGLRTIIEAAQGNSAVMKAVEHLNGIDTDIDISPLSISSVTTDLMQASTTESDVRRSLVSPLKRKAAPRHQQKAMDLLTSSTDSSRQSRARCSDREATRLNSLTRNNTLANSGYKRVDLELQLVKHKNVRPPSPVTLVRSSSPSELLLLQDEAMLSPDSQSNSEEGQPASSSSRKRITWKRRSDFVQILAFDDTEAVISIQAMKLKAFGVQSLSSLSAAQGSIQSVAELAADNNASCSPEATFEHQEEMQESTQEDSCIDAAKTNDKLCGVSGAFVPSRSPEASVGDEAIQLCLSDCPRRSILRKQSHLGDDDDDDDDYHQLDEPEESRVEPSERITVPVACFVYKNDDPERFIGLSSLPGGTEILN